MNNFSANLWDEIGARCKLLMLNLVYPAFLGTFLVAMWSGYGTLGAVQRAAGWLLIAYFVVGFSETLSERGDRYNFPVFAVDVAEVTLMAFLFAALGTYSSSTVNGDRDLFWRLAPLLFLAPMLWRIAAGYSEWAYDALCFCAIAICLYVRFGAGHVGMTGLSSAFWGDRPSLVLDTVADDFGITLLWALLAIYLVVVVLDCGFQWSGARNVPAGQSKAGSWKGWSVERRTPAAKVMAGVAAIATGVALLF